MNSAALVGIGAAWSHLVETGQVDETMVRAEVARSWLRCRALGIDPRAPKLPVTLSAAQVAALREENRGFIETALPFMEFLRTAVKGSGFILVLTEASGIVLDVFGDEEVMAMAADNNYVAGCVRSEEVAGTNAISLALIEKRPIQLRGAEHWNVRHHRWTCASAPVFSPQGVLLGAVTLSGETTRAHSHTLGMVISAAEAICERLRERELQRQKRGVDAMLSSVLTSISDAIVTIDGAGIISSINPAACKILGAEEAASVGQSILQIFPGLSDFVTQLPLGKECSSFEVTSERLTGRAHFVLTPYVMQAGDEVRGAILAVRERREFLNEVRDFSGFNAVFTFDHIIGESPALLRQIEVARVTARQNARILILGETGTGKELFAQAIHNGSLRRRGPFVALNCAAIPRELMESELFGYRGGAFTGSRKGGQVGKLELADGGSLFLDEINQMPLDLQPKLLRALQEGVITPLGDSKPIRIDVRVIAASNEDLYAKSSAGAFRQDLYYRLSVVELSLPPLRERADDIPLIAAQLLRKLAANMNKRAIELSPAAMEALRQYPWPGNVRELENVLELGAIMAEGATIEPAHMAYRLRLAAPQPSNRDAAPADQGRMVRDMEIDLIRAAIEEFNGNVGDAARKIGMSRSTIYRRMQQHGMVKSVSVR
jgi:sigma-54 dependent transcriptional regulator, acetoin dehydrogenase operon transcriptional activator AcoR